MPIKVRIPTPLRTLTNGVDLVSISPLPTLAMR